MSTYFLASPKNFGVNTNVTPNIAVTKDIDYKAGDLGSLSNDEQVGMRYSGASPPLSSTTKCEDGVDADTPASRVTYEDKSDAYGNFTFSKEIGYNKQP